MRPDPQDVEHQAVVRRPMCLLGTELGASARTVSLWSSHAPRLLKVLVESVHPSKTAI